MKKIALLGGVLCLLASQAIASQEVVINELAWMGTTTSTSDEWVELYNPSGAAIDLTGWTLKADDGSPSITLSGTIAAKGFFLLERSNDDSVPGIAADQIYTGALENGGEALKLRDDSSILIDEVDAWHAGDNSSKSSMERASALEAGTSATNWSTATASYSAGKGTPRAANSDAPLPAQESINTVSDAAGAINIYFNKNALTAYATAGNLANYNVNLETRLIQRIEAATSSIDVAIYEINLADIAEALIERASAGVDIRLIADSKDPDPADEDRTSRWEQMRLCLERMARGADGSVDTSDDIHLFSDSPILAVEDSAKRTDYGLPSTPSGFDLVTVNVGTRQKTGYLVADAETKANGDYYSEADQMHNKFVIIDGTWVWTGSWNFTTTGLYGSEDDQAAGVLAGNSQHAVELNSTALADIFTVEFEEMWGSATLAPSPSASDFHSRKSDNTAHSVTVGGRTVEVYFSPGDDAVGKVTDYVANNADFSCRFTIFAWSDQNLLDEVKLLWEGSKEDLVGTLTGFEVKGVFDSSFWNQWWSASVDMRGETVTGSANNPNIRWNNEPDIFIDDEDRKLHSKTMLIDADTSSSPAVVVGSTNWSINGNDVNDENLLIIHDADIVNQFVQEFWARFQAAGGSVPTP